MHSNPKNYGSYDRNNYKYQSRISSSIQRIPALNPVTRDFLNFSGISERNFHSTEIGTSFSNIRSNLRWI